jgi:hypothetical protein
MRPALLFVMVVLGSLSAGCGITGGDESPLEGTQARVLVIQGCQCPDKPAATGILDVALRPPDGVTIKSVEVFRDDFARRYTIPVVAIGSDQNPCTEQPGQMTYKGNTAIFESPTIWNDPTKTKVRLKVEYDKNGKTGTEEVPVAETCYGIS